MKSKKLLIISGIIGFVALGLYLIRSSFFSYRVSPSIMLTCPLRGGKLFACLGPGPCGCFVPFTDAGKLCTSGHDCRAGACIVGQYSQAGSDGLFKGTCPTGDFVQSPPQKYTAFCGEATIENGRIVNDMRGCIY